MDNSWTFPLKSNKKIETETSKRLSEFSQNTFHQKFGKRRKWKTRQHSKLSDHLPNPSLKVTLDTYLKQYNKIYSIKA